MRQKIEKLHEILSQEDTLLFVGSGVSLWSGLPTWTGLIEELADFLNRLGRPSALVMQEAKRGDLLQAASYGFSKLTPSEIGQFMRQVCRAGESKPHNIHELIVKMGPRCFITTNYDDLLEQALRNWRPDVAFGSAVTNRHVPAIADLVQSRKQNFVFKPHGDVYDIDSVILTREQYRLLLPQGERHATLDALKTLMLTRPIVYIGFGLRDPDFLYLKDVMGNIYRGANVDHYAIMADISNEEEEYWLKNFGLHLVSYETTTDEKGKRSHFPLISFLNNFEKRNVHAAEVTLSSLEEHLLLARYAAGVVQRLEDKQKHAIQLYVSRVKAEEDKVRFRALDYMPLTIPKVTAETTGGAIFIGGAGSGKSHSIRNCVEVLARRLRDTTIEGSSLDSVQVPILCDLKLYDGDLEKLINSQLPALLNVRSLSRKFNLCIFMDSFNEMDNAYIEGSIFREDFELISSFLKNTRFFFGSRDGAGLQFTGFKKFMMKPVHEEQVKDFFVGNHLSLPRNITSEHLRVFSLPIYLKFAAEGQFKIKTDTRAIEIYNNIILSYVERFRSRFDLPENLDIADILSTVAINCLDAGTETFSAAELYRGLASVFIDNPHIVQDAVNWMLSEQLLVSYSGSRLSFMHQSITEYLASCKIVDEIRDNPHVVMEKIKHTRWDNALLMCAGMMDDDSAAVYFRNLLNFDFKVAVGSLRYSQIDTKNTVGYLIDYISENPSVLNSEFGTLWFVKKSIVVCQEHLPQLKDLLGRGGRATELAAELMIELDPCVAKPYLLRLIIEKPNSYNLLVNSIANNLKGYVNVEDVKTLGDYCDQIESEKGLEGALALSGFCSAVGKLLGTLPVVDVYAAMFPNASDVNVASVRRAAFAQALYEGSSIRHLEFCLELLLKGENEVVFNISSRYDFGSGDIFNIHHVDALVESLLPSADISSNEWAFEALRKICVVRRDLGDYLSIVADSRSGFERSALLIAAGADTSIVFDGLREFVKSNSGVGNFGSFLGRIDMSWEGHEDLFVSLLKLKDVRLARSILKGSNPPDLGNVRGFNLGEMNWWVEWIRDLLADRETWVAMQVSWLTGTYCGAVGRLELLKIVNDKSVPLLDIADLSVLPYIKDLSVDELEDWALERLIELEVRNGLGFRGCLSRIADNALVTSRLLPKLAYAEGERRSNLVRIIRDIGERLGQRFINDLGDRI